MDSLERLIALPSQFKWQQGVTPLSSFHAVVACCCVYLVTILGLKALISWPISLPKAVPAIHNFILCFGSLLMFLGAGWEAIKVSF